MNTISLRRCVRQGPALVLGLLSFAGSAFAQQVALKIQPASLPSAASDQGALSQSTPVTLTLYLQPSADRVAALGQFLVDVQTPGNAAYKAWLSPAQFGQQFGATADQVARVSAWAQANGMTLGSVAASGLSVSLSGTAAQMESALAPGLHNLQVGGSIYVANTATPKVAQSVASDIVSIGGLSTLPSAHPFTVATSEGSSAVDDALAAMNAVVAANTGRVVSLNSTSCVDDVDAASQAAMHLLLQEANAQGITVLAASGCGSRGSAGYPAAFSEVTAAAPSVGITPSANPTLSELRPGWQDAAGLPSDAFRHEPDFAVSSLSALQQTVNTILPSEPASADGSAARLGNMNGTLYELAPVKGLYTQPDHAAAGTWEAATGLGVVDLAKLADAYPRGSLSSYTSVDLSPYYGAHGATFTFTSTVKDISGQGNGAVPTGSITFSFNSNVASQTVALNNGTATYTTNQLPAGSLTVTATYSGDGTYAPSNSVTDSFTITGEAADISVTQQGTAQVGGDIVLLVTVKADSGVGTPTGKATVQPRGGSDSNTYTGTLSGSNGVATATVLVPATQATGITLLVNCDGSNPNYTCYSAQQFTPSISKATPQVTLSYSPNPVVSGQNATFTATVFGAGNNSAAPQGNVNFSNNGVVIGSGTLSSSGIATLTTPNFDYSSSGNTFVATYGGDNNYNSNASNASGSSGPIATTTTVSVSSTSVPVGGTATLYAVVTPSTTGSAAISGTVSFVVGTTTLCTGTVTAQTASCTATFTARGANGPIEANYKGDANYASSTSGSQYVTVSVVQGNTQVVITASPATPVAGQPTTFTATVTNTNGSTSAAAITGNVSFYVNGATVSAANVNSSGQVTYMTTLPNGTDTVFAVYSGDGNWNGSQSATSTYTVGSSSSGSSGSTLTLTSNTLLTVAGANVVLTATVTPPAGSTATSPFSGSVTFFDVYNGGASTALGTVSVTSNGPGGGTAQFSTTGLQNGRHVITAVYSGNSSYASETSAPLTIFLSDYSLSFAPASLTLTAGSSGSTTVTVNPLTSFTGTVNLACIPPTLVYITCSFNPASVSASGTSTLTVTTQMNHAENEYLPLRGAVGGVALAALVFGFLLPGRRRRMPALFALLLTVALVGSLGCTDLKNAGTGSSLVGGTPTGVYNLTISSSGTYQGATVTHSQQFQVTVQ